MNIESISQKVFAELGKEKQLVEYHNIMNKLLGVVIDFINADGESLKLSKMKHFNTYCAMIRSSESGFASCQSCDRANAHTASIKHKELVYKCHAGLIEIVLPLYDSKGNYIGCMTSGQFLLEGEAPADKKLIEKTAWLHALDPLFLYKSYRKSKVLSRLQMEGIIDYLNEIGRLIVKTHNNLLFLETVDSPDKILLIKQFVANNYMKKMTIPETAKRFFFCPGHFCRFFKNEVGVSFMCFVNMYRISKAEEMLELTKRNISEIAFLSGFGSISQFNRMFKNIKGVSPRDFRINPPGKKPGNAAL